MTTGLADLQLSSLVAQPQCLAKALPYLSEKGQKRRWGGSQGGSEPKVDVCRQSWKQIPRELSRFVTAVAFLRHPNCDRIGSLTSGYMSS